MNLHFNISPLNPDNVIDYYTCNEGGIEVAYIRYAENKAHVLETWNVRLPLTIPDRPYRCGMCGYRDISSFSRCRLCGTVCDITASAGTGQGKPSFELAYYPKDNAKDKLIFIGGRACLVLGTVEAVFSDVSPENIEKVYILSFYISHQTASAKYNVLHFCYYNFGTGQLFVDERLKKLNDLLWKETIEHNFGIVPEWSVSKIYEIYMKGSV